MVAEKAQKGWGEDFYYNALVATRAMEADAALGVIHQDWRGT